MDLLASRMNDLSGTWASEPIYAAISLRHTFATKLAELGVDILTVGKLLGHSDIKTTMVYAKANVTVQRMAVNLLGPSR